MPTYLGIREPETPPGEEHCAEGRVVVREGELERALPEAQPPDDYPITFGGFEWGYSGSGPINLAAALLSDLLGFVPSVTVVMNFHESVVAELPRAGFEIEADVLHAWLDVRLTQGCVADPSAV